MKSAVVYCSRSGNTRKVADAIAEDLGTTAKSVKDDFTLEGVDLLFVGSGCYAGKPGKEMERFIGNIKDIKKAAVFGTYSGRTDAIKLMKKALEKNGITVLDEWGCTGSFLYLLNRGRPNETDLETAREFANSALEKAMD